jgi:hypothetical protein
MTTQCKSCGGFCGSKCERGNVGFGPPKRSISITVDELKQIQMNQEAVWMDAKRLAMELECLLMSCDLPAASKWWDSANEALELHRQLIKQQYEQAEEQSNG